MAWSDAARAAALATRRMHMKGKGDSWLAAYNRGEGTRAALKEAYSNRVSLGTTVRNSGAKPVSKRQAARNKKYMTQRNARIANGSY